jgi:hypothetical protein
MPHQSNPPWLDHPNNTWWSVQVMKLLIVQSSPLFHLDQLNNYQLLREALIMEFVILPVTSS